MKSWILELKVFLLEDIEPYKTKEKIAAFIYSTYYKD